MPRNNNSHNNIPPGRGDDGLTPRKALFVAEYLKDRNATKAATRAGYSAATAQQQGSRLLKDPSIKAAIAKAKDGTPTPGPVAAKPAAQKEQTPAPDPVEESKGTAAMLLARNAKTDPKRPERPLTMIEESFIAEYLRNGLNGTAAWMFTHPGCSPDAAAVAASQAIRRPKVAARLAAERDRLAKKHDMTRDQLLMEFLAIVRADPNELTQMRAVACEACWPDQPRRGRWTEPDADCPECQGEGHSVPWIADTRKLSHEARALYAGIQITKDGVKVLMHDKTAALVSIARILGAFEKDNAQKRPELSEALAQFVAQIHDEGAGRLKFAPRATATAVKVQH